MFELCIVQRIGDGFGAIPGAKTLSFNDFLVVAVFVPFGIVGIHLHVFGKTAIRAVGSLGVVNAQLIGDVPFLAAVLQIQ